MHPKSCAQASDCVQVSETSEAMHLVIIRVRDKLGQFTLSHSLGWQGALKWLYWRFGVGETQPTRATGVTVPGDDHNPADDNEAEQD